MADVVAPPPVRSVADFTRSENSTSTGAPEELAGRGGDAAYAEGAKLIARMASLQSAAEQTAYVAALKMRHGRKRKFVALLG